MYTTVAARGDYGAAREPMAGAELNLHEELTRDDEVVGSSDRSFGLLLAGVALLTAGVKGWHGNGAEWWWLAEAAIFAVAGAVYPAALAPLSWLWLRFGLAMYTIVNPIVMALIFYAAVLPTALIAREMGTDFLRLKRNPAANSYWIRREPAGPASETMKHQF